jgi:hypothetical protein
MWGVRCISLRRRLRRGDEWWVGGWMDVYACLESEELAIRWCGNVLQQNRSGILSGEA